MQKLEKFQISKAPYAVQLASFSVDEQYSTYTNPDGSSRRGDTPHYRIEIPAIWFRRKDGVLSAQIGTLWDYLRERPADATSWLESAWDGRYGGNCSARWDGECLWAPDTTWERMVEDQAFLDAMLKGFPEAPAGYDGWWTFKRPN
jgi:hypothetical protein